MAQKKLHFETLQLHVGQENPDPVTGARAVPIYQTTSYVFNNSQHAADRFGLRDAGNIYGRLTNSTQGVFEDRVAALEGGVAGLAVASGAAAITYALQNIAQNGDHIVAADNIYGGSYNLITHTLTTQGVDYSIVDFSDYDAIEKAIKPNTKVIFAETLGNPNSEVVDIERIAAIAHEAGIPLEMVYLDIDYMERYKDFTINEIISDCATRGKSLYVIAENEKLENYYKNCGFYPIGKVLYLKSW